ncbi:lipid droplet-associated hydrolase isoform X1 [Macrobrachium rosenbergii]|uniref:lipid droplet-associated hydrolase isoform X1 n=1 Tax=Macrobrachium rosenbergii TaxID=79674 RepID=UPI0034D7683A
MRLPASGKSLQGLKIMADISRQEILVRGKPTEFLSIGKSLNEDPKKILLIIPGNPGVVSYYREFMQHLYDGVRDTHSVWAVSHAGHSHTPSLSFWPSNQHVYDLEEQVLHKMAFIMDHVPKGAQITLIGHSIGSYIILRLLKAMEAHSEINIEKNYLLFPTIERMKVSPNGEKLWPWLSYFRWLVIFFTVLAYILPVTVKQTILKLYFSRKEISEGSLKATIELLHPKIIQNVLWMAYNELKYVNDADKETVSKYKDKLVFYYGASDGWCPQLYRTELLQKIDGLTSFLCEEGFPHAFVLSKSEGVAKKVVGWIAS